MVKWALSLSSSKSVEPPDLLQAGDSGPAEQFKAGDDPHAGAAEQHAGAVY